MRDGATEFIDVCALAEIPLVSAASARGKVVKPEGRQIALFRFADDQVYACANRCPHEGYPLAEGHCLSRGPTRDGESPLLTCNWHNWKFDLATGKALIGADPVRVYGVELRDGRVFIDLADPPEQARRAEVVASLREGLAKKETGRMLRDMIRLARAGSSVEEGLSALVEETSHRQQFGMTHCFAAAPDWLALSGRIDGGEAERLALINEIMGNFADDITEHRTWPFPEDQASYSDKALVQAIENEDEERALALVQGGLAQGLDFAGFEAALTEAALAHYQDFGHSLIYVQKARELVARLGPATSAPVLLNLTRCLIYASREDLIPQFKDYRPAVAAYREKAASGEQGTFNAEALKGAGVARALALVVEAAPMGSRLYPFLLSEIVRQFRCFDNSLQDRTDNAVSDNVSWLDVTHGLTFANAVRSQCTRFPDFWPEGLLQIACFLGRNASTTNEAAAPALPEAIRDDALGAIDGLLAGLVDHGISEYIVTAHLVKTATAGRQEARSYPDLAPEIAHALQRFFTEPLKRRHGLRSARQALDLVAREL